MNLLKSQQFILHAVFLCGKDLVTEVCLNMTVLTNAKNLQQYKIQTFFDCRLDNGFRFKL